MSQDLQLPKVYQVQAQLLCLRIHRPSSVLPLCGEAEGYLMHLIMPLCLKVCSGRGVSEVGELKMTDVNLLTAVLNAMSPPAGRTGQAVSQINRVGGDLRTGSLTFTGSRMRPARIAGIVRVMRDLGRRNEAAPDLWSFLEFVVTHRTPLYIVLMPFILHKISQPPIGDHERHMQFIIRERLRGTPPQGGIKSKGALLLELAEAKRTCVMNLKKNVMRQQVALMAITSHNKTFFNFNIYWNNDWSSYTLTSLLLCRLKKWFRWNLYTVTLYLNKLCIHLESLYQAALLVVITKQQTKVKVANMLLLQLYAAQPPKLWFVSVNLGILEKLQQHLYRQKASRRQFRRSYQVPTTKIKAASRNFSFKEVDLLNGTSKHSGHRFVARRTPKPIGEISWDSVSQTSSTSGYRDTNSLQTGLLSPDGSLGGLTLGRSPSQHSLLMVYEGRDEDTLI
ncbi:Protein unc-80 homolog [Eumeta japonica]|uniref:Protein unc-80 homolog n=1 Tax=Eumeta variegata TaxID=151549 RepID=A0A4C1SV11_EUMVA|nr:Protein unc-80 homolog [Eumeta japonica]